MLGIVFAVAACGSSNGGSGTDGAGSNDNVDATPFTNGVSTLAGSSEAGFIDGDRVNARFSNPVNVARAPDGRIIVADFDNSKLRAIDVDTHETTTIISQTSFKRPFGLALAADGTLFVSTDNDQAGNHTPMSGTIWKVNVTARTATVIANALGRPRGLAVLPDGRLAVADDLHHVVQLINVSTGQATMIAGSWSSGTARGQVVPT